MLFYYYYLNNNKGGACPTAITLLAKSKIIYILVLVLYNTLGYTTYIYILIAVFKDDKKTFYIIISPPLSLQKICAIMSLCRHYGQINANNS